MKDSAKISDEHISYIRAIAHNIKKTTRVPDGAATLDDLIAYGAIGYLQARDRYDGRDGVEFMTFATYRIRGAMFDGLRAHGWVPRGMFAEKAVFVLVCEPLDPVLLLHPDPKGKAEDDQLDDLEFDEIARTMHRAIRRLPKKERELIRRYYFGDLSLDSVGKSIGLSKSWTSRLHDRTIEKLRRLYLTVQAELEDNSVSLEEETFSETVEGLEALLKRLEE